MNISKKKKVYLYFVFLVIISFIVFKKHFLNINRKPDILLITIDALRPDHLGCYGYPRNTSPNIDRFTKDAIIFENCFSTSSSTVFASVGLLTGKYLNVRQENQFNLNVLDFEFTTLAEFLKKFGYSTAYFTGNSRYRKSSGFEQGFDYHGFLNYDAPSITFEAQDFIKQNKGDKPLFIWLHFMDTHIPYVFKKDLFERFSNDQIYKNNDKILNVNPQKLDKNNDFQSWENNWEGYGYIPRAALHEGKYSFSYYVCCYDSEIFFVDQSIGELLKKFKNNSIVVISADHGEGLGEHNKYFTHGGEVYDELIRIPLIIKDTSYFNKGTKISESVSSIDIVPTILSAVNPAWYFFNKNKFDGIDLKEIVLNKNSKRKFIYSYTCDYTAVQDVNKKIKYIFGDAEEDKLYILPDETRNLINENSLEGIRKEMKNHLFEWLRSYPVYSDVNAKEVSLDEEARQELRRLGYLQ